CTLSDDLAAQLSDLAQAGAYDYIIVEASGICEPMPIAYTISEYCQQAAEGASAATAADEPAVSTAEPAAATGAAAPAPAPLLALDNIVAVVDCARMLHEFDGGKRLLRQDLNEDDVESLLVQQIEFCTTLVLNKTDLVSAEQLAEVRAIVRTLQKDATIVEAEHGQVPLGQVLGTRRFDFDEVYQSAAWLDMLAHPEEHEDPETLEYGISTFVYERRRPFSVQAFSDFATNWPDSVIRTKGFAWVDQDPDTCFILEQAGAQRSFTDNGPFVASLPEEDQQRILQQNPGVAARWSPECGDRLIRLVFIGKDMDRAAIEARLDACLAG
ncbi:MAG TPA: GTP-binding protein, partial [Eggerthellaceae bacterium]|nr:GTP-binding protein [Eggerthellaceae bacterium]